MVKIFGSKTSAKYGALKNNDNRRKEKKVNLSVFFIHFEAAHVYDRLNNLA